MNHLNDIQTTGIILEFFDYIFFPQSEISQIINLVIFAIAACILGWILIQYFRIGIAYFRFKQFRKVIEEKKDKVLTHENVEDILKKQKHKLINRKILIINKLREDSKGMLDAIDHIDAELQWHTYGILRYPISSLIIFGLLGTVWGLQRAIYSLMPTMQNELDLEKLQEVMLGTLTGMQTAFTTTLAGLFFSIVFGFIAFTFLKTSVNRYIVDVKRFLIQSIIPAYTLLGSDHLDTLSEKTRELKESVSDIAKHSDILFQPIIESAGNFKSGMDQVFSAAQTFITASESINNLSSTLNGSLQHLSGTLAEVRQSLDMSRDIQDEIEKTVKYIAGVPEYFDKLMNRLTDEFKAHQEKMEQQHASKLITQIDRLTDTVEGLSSQSEEWKKESAETGNFLRNAAKESIGEFYDRIDALLKKVTKSSLNMDEINRTLTGTLEKISTDQTTISDQYVNAHKNQLDAITRVLHNFMSDSQKNQDHNNKQVLDAISEWVQYNQLLVKALDGINTLPEKIAKAVGSGNGHGIQVQTTK